MACANILLTIFAILMIVFTMMPNLLGAANTIWATVILAVLVIIIAWTGVKCRFCKK